MKIDTIVISDLHLGHPSCNRDNILKILNLEFDKLIVNGDVFSCYHDKNLTSKDYWILEILEYFQSKNKCVITKGNHELYINYKVHTSLEFVDFYNWNFHGYNMYAEHGHKIRPLNNLMGKLHSRALTLAKNKGYQCIFTGHNHSAKVIDADHATYINTGTFINLFNYYVCLYRDGTYSFEEIRPKFVVCDNKIYPIELIMEAINKYNEIYESKRNTKISC